MVPFLEDLELRDLPSSVSFPPLPVLPPVQFPTQSSASFNPLQGLTQSLSPSKVQQEIKALAFIDLLLTLEGHQPLSLFHPTLNVNVFVHPAVTGSSTT